MFQWARKLLGYGGAKVGAPARQPVRARYENAQSTDDTQRSWWLADYLSAKSANSFQVRRTLRMRSRHEVSNNPYLWGISSNNADDLIGAKGPTLKVLTPDKAYNAAVESAWSEWADEVGLVEKLRTLKLARTVDGEGFLVLKTVADLYSSVKLYPLDVEADQVTTPAPANLEQLWVDGMELHPVTGRPAAYHVLRHHPGDYYFPDLDPLKVDRVKARHVIHWFPKFRPGQVRGIPVFTPALDLFSELRAYRKAVLAKAQIAANLTAVLESEAPADTGDDAASPGTAAPSPFSTVPIDRGLFTELPAGYKLNQFATGEPSTTYEMFQEKGLGEACRPLNYPLNLALGTSQKFNFSSAKLDHINYHAGLTVERGQCEDVALGRLFVAWHEEAVRVPGLLPKAPEGLGLRAPPRAWHWPGYASIDPESDARTDIARLNGGVQTWREFWAQRGHDWRQVMAQQDEERKELEKLGLSFGEPMKKTERVDGDAPDDAPPGKGKPPGKKANAVRAAYDPDQPRDDHGRFGEGGGGSGKEDEIEERRGDAQTDLNIEHEEEKDALERKHLKEDARTERDRDREDKQISRDRREEDKVNRREDREVSKELREEKKSLRQAVDEESAAEYDEAEKRGAGKDELDKIVDKWDAKHDEELDRIDKKEVAELNRREAHEDALQERRQGEDDELEGKREKEDEARTGRQVKELEELDAYYEKRRRELDEHYDAKLKEAAGAK